MIALNVAGRAMRGVTQGLRNSIDAAAEAQKVHDDLGACGGGQRDARSDRRGLSARNVSRHKGLFFFLPDEEVRELVARAAQRS